VFDFGSGLSAEMRKAFRCLGPVFQTPQFFDKWEMLQWSRNMYLKVGYVVDSRRSVSISKGCRDVGELGTGDILSSF